MTDLGKELDRRQSNRDAVADYLKSHPNQWIPAQTLMELGGILAWRTRVSEARRDLGMCIQNMQSKAYDPLGIPYTLSSYRYLPQEPLGRSADVPAPDVQPRTLFAL